MLIVGNWKAYVQSTEKAKKLFAHAKRLASRQGVEIVLAPPAPYLGMFAPGNRSKVSFAAQDLSLSTGGATTGEITAATLSGLGVEYVILGHSERRAMGETDQMIAEKVQHALANKLTPIVCVGEKERDQDAQYLKGLRAQIAAIFTPLSHKERMQTVIAYEPIWAIGKTAAEAITSQDLMEMMLYIRKVLTEYIPGRGAEKVRLIYGGSVEPANARQLAGGTGVDGFLPGHASVDPESFAALVKAVS
jgi:triosephosphate isomerase